MKSKLLVPMLFIAALLSSCKKDKSLDVQMPETSNSILTKTPAEQIKYAEVNLKKIADAIGPLTKNPAFVNYIHQQVARKVDGQFEVLIEHLVKSPEFGAILNTKEINDALAAFKNLQDENFYPQIYIPKMQNDEDNQVTNLTSSNSTTDITNVKIVVYGGEMPGVAEDAPHPSYKVETNGTLTAFQNINEAYVNENEVWVFSLNEVITTQSLMQLPSPQPCSIAPDDPECYISSGGGGGGGSSSDPNAEPAELARSPHPDMGLYNPIDVKIDKMIIKKTHEYFLSGASEVAIRAALNTINGRHEGNPTDDFWVYKTLQDGNGKHGKMIKEFTRSQVRDETSLILNYDLVLNWPSNPSNINRGPVYYDLVIFERDHFPTTAYTLYRQNFLNYNYKPNDDYFSHSYRSADIAYDINRIVNLSSLLNPVAPAKAPIYYDNSTSSGIDNSIVYNVKLK